MLAFLFLASVANANNAFSASNEFMAVAQRFASQLQAQMGIHAQNGRRLSSTKPCEWNDKGKHCDLSATFALQSGELDNYPDTKTWALVVEKCRKIKAQADCGSEDKCQFKENECQISDKQNNDFMFKVMKIEECGDFVVATMNQQAQRDADACLKKDKSACTGTCYWQNEYVPDDDNKKCKDDSKCRSKSPPHDPKDPFGLKRECPKMTAAQKDACEKKDYQGKVDCFLPICPHGAVMTAYMNCMAPKDADSCKKAASVCAWNGEQKRCSLDMPKLYSELIPDTCAMKDMFMSGFSDCGNLQDKAGCDKDNKCKWEKSYECSGMQIKTAGYCRADNGDQNMIEGFSKDIFGARLDAQMKTCQTGKDEKTCVYTKELDLSVCANKTNSAVKDICTQAVAQNIATLPLKNGVTNLDRTISTKFKVHQHELKDVCGKGATYAIPASHNFDFTSSSNVVADTTKTGFGEPEYSFRCDAATDLYTLVLFDSMALPVKTRTGVPHMVRVNMGCTDKKMSDPKNLGVNLMGQYMPPANPMPIPFLYQFYLFKQSKRVVLKDNKLAGFNPMELQMMAMPNDMQTGKPRKPNMYLDTVLLAKLKPYLVPGGPVARNWQRLVGSPVSAQFFKMMKYDMGQCADAVRNTWKYYLVTKMGPPALRLKSSHASIALGPEGDVKLARSKHGELTIKGDVGAPSLSVKDLKIGGVGIMEYIQKRVMERLQELKKQ